MFPDTTVVGLMKQLQQIICTDIISDIASAFRAGREVPLG